MASVYISYTNADEDYARDLAAALAGFGHTSYSDVLLAAPNGVHTVLSQAMRISDALIFILSSEWTRDSNILAELGAAVDYSRDSGQLMFIPVTRDSVRVPSVATTPYAISSEGLDIDAVAARITDSISEFITARSRGKKSESRGTREGLKALPIDRRYQVFVSSTYIDLIDERSNLIQALLQMSCLPAGMELFPASNETQWDLIKRTIDDSDYYIVVVGGRYGSISPDGVSYTEQEYDYAVSTHMPVLGFVHASPDSLPRTKTEVDPDLYKRLAAFRGKVKTRNVQFYTSAEDLGGKVSRSLTSAWTQEPREGWVRGRFAMTPETHGELSELRNRLSTLEWALKQR